MSAKQKFLFLTLIQITIAIFASVVWFSMIYGFAIKSIDDAPGIHTGIPEDWKYFVVDHGEYREIERPPFSENPYSLVLHVFCIVAAVGIIFITAKPSKRLQHQIKGNTKNPEILDNIFKYTSLTIVSILTFGILIITVLNCI